MLDREKVGRAISEQRKIKGMTQKQLADLLNVSYQAVSRWEQGISLPSVDMIYDIAQLIHDKVICFDDIWIPVWMSKNFIWQKTD